MPRRPKATPALPAAPRARDLLDEAWGEIVALSDLEAPARSTIHIATLSLHQIVSSAPHLRIPAWQRGAVWTGERACDYARALVSGLNLSPILIWERWTPTQQQIVVDGQQRLLSLGLTIPTHTGEPRTGAAAHWHLDAADWRPYPASPGRVSYTLADMASAGGWHLTRGPDSLPAHTVAGRCTVAQAAAALSIWSAVRNGTIYAGHLRTADATEARAVFAAWNVPGAPFEPGEIDRLLALADG